jgi:Ca2+-dependent lipid-binding protein
MYCLAFLLFNMPCILKVRIVSARHLPVMDRTSDLTGKFLSKTDAFVEVRFADLEAKKTPIFRKSLNPVWNEDFRFVFMS